MKRDWIIAKMGTTIAEIRDKRGDFEQWIARKCGLSTDEVKVIQCYKGEELPEPDQSRALIITGSSAMVSERAVWSERVAYQIPAFIAARVPTLGICYGHQLIAHALGGIVKKNPRGREIGTITVHTSEAASTDPLFCDMGSVFEAHATHTESVVSPPSNVELLGASSLDPHQIFRVGDRTWGVQFHPEFDAFIMRAYIEGRRQRIEGEQLNADELLANVKETASGTQLLQRFANLVTRFT